MSHFLLPYYEIWLMGWLTLAPIVGALLLYRKEIPRGSKRTNKTKLSIDTRLGWILKEAPGAINMSYWFLRPRHWQEAAIAPIAYVFLAAYSTHYIYRILIYPQLLRTNGQRDITVENLLHTTWWHLCNEGLIGLWLTEICDYDATTWLSSPCFLGGWALFAFGFGICVTHDVLLIAMRQPTGPGDPTSPGKRIRRIPTGGLFNLVTQPNYFGECIEWLGFAIMTWSLPGLAFFVWSLANLVPTALANRDWYRREFKDKDDNNKYPQHIKAIIPYIL